MDLTPRETAGTDCGLEAPDLRDETGATRVRCDLTGGHVGLHHDTERGYKWADLQVNWS